MALPLLAIAAAVGAGASGLATIGSGIMSARANKANALGARIEADLARLRGKQIAERSREDLSRALGNIGAIRTARGVSSDSMTGRAIERRTIQDAYRDEGVAVLGETMRRSAALQAARGYKTAARWAIPIAVLQSGGQFAQAASYGSMARGG